MIGLLSEYRLFAGDVTYQILGQYDDCLTNEFRVMGGPFWVGFRLDLLYIGL